MSVKFMVALTDNSKYIKRLTKSFIDFRQMYWDSKSVRKNLKTDTGIKVKLDFKRKQSKLKERNIICGINGFDYMEIANDIW